MGELTGKTIIIIHGWSDKWTSMRKIGKPLEDRGAEVRYANYDSREDQALYEDFAEGLQQELERMKIGGKALLDGKARSLHFVTHSTGALVLRQWFKQYENSQAKVGNVVFLAPPNFGSPLAKVGQSLIGKIFKGQHGHGDDFEVGENILHGLELASPFSWGLAEYDLFGPSGTIYRKDNIRASVITGHQGYGGLRRFVNKPGTDGTIVVAGANLNARYLKLDFSKDSGSVTSRWHGFDLGENPQVPPPDLPFLIYKDLTHASILELKENIDLQESVIKCLRASPDEYENIRKSFHKRTQEQIGAEPEEKLGYQQVLFRVVDDRNVPVQDYHLEFNVWDVSKVTNSGGGPNHVPAEAMKDITNTEQELSGMLDEMLEQNLHTHSQDSGYKRYLLSPKKVKGILQKAMQETGKKFAITMRIDAHSRDRDIHYRTHLVDNYLLYHPDEKFHKIHPFLPNTTTLIQIRIDRESTLMKLRTDEG